VSVWQHLPMFAATAVENLRACRISLGVSQSRLARLAGVSRFKICTYELGDRALTHEEQSRIRVALEKEAQRLRDISIQIEFDRPPLSSLEEVRSG
jgi:predicted transcriptional regulator